jgi:hypothetical protein
MKVLLIGNLSDRRCGFQNFTAQMQTALYARGDVDLSLFDGTYSRVYERQQIAGTPYLGMFPADVAEFDVVHIIWNAMTMNHYAGAPWVELVMRKIVTSWWDGGPSDASCPFESLMLVKWSDYPREGYEYSAYPVPDWVEDLYPPNRDFTVGASSVRGDGMAAVQRACERNGWALNLPEPGQWLSIEAEIRRLSRSTVNVCWYNTPPLWKNRASAPSMLLAAERPLLINYDPLVAHLDPYEVGDGIYRGRDNSPEALEAALVGMAGLHQQGGLHTPQRPFHDLRWTRAARHFVTIWANALAATRG